MRSVSRRLLPGTIALALALAGCETVPPAPQVPVDTGSGGIVGAGDDPEVWAEIVLGGGGGVFIQVDIKGSVSAGHKVKNAAIFAGNYASTTDIPDKKFPPALNHLVVAELVPGGVLPHSLSAYTKKLDVTKPKVWLFVDLQMENGAGELRHHYYRWIPTPDTTNPKHKRPVDKTGFKIELTTVNKITGESPIPTPAKVKY